MIDELIVDIKKSELKADEIIRNSLIKAKDIVTTAKAEAEQIAIKSSGDLRLLNEEIVNTANISAEKKYAEIIAEANIKAEEMKSIGAKNKIEAVKMIVDKVLG